MSNIVLLLTCCVSPNGMSFVAINDVNIRLEQYIEAIQFYIRETNVKIVIVENSNYDFSYHFTEEISNKRVEFITFDGNNFDRRLGKGYGEIKMLEYVLINSVIITDDSLIAKITGRIIIGNINKFIQIVTEKKRFYDKIIFADIFISLNYMSSVFFIAPKQFYLQYFIPNNKYINDSKGVYFEHILLHSIRDWKLQVNNKFIQTHIPINYIGYSGSTGGRMDSKSSFLDYFKAIIKYIYVTLRFR